MGNSEKKKKRRSKTGRLGDSRKKKKKLVYTSEKAGRLCSKNQEAKNVVNPTPCGEERNAMGSGKEGVPS